jgi:hypothetical protein
VPIWDQFLDVVVYFSRFLTLASPLAENYVFGDSSFNSVLQISLNSQEACFFRVLQIKSMTFGNFSVDCLLDPGNRVDNFVAPYFFHQVDCKCIFCIDGPNDKQSTIFLEFWDRYFFDVLIIEAVILDGNTSGRLRSRKFPWRIHHNDVEIGLADLKLFFDEIIEVEFGDIGTDGDGVFTDLGGFGLIKGEILLSSYCSLMNWVL